MLMEKPHVFLLVKQLNLLALRRHMALFHLLELKSEGEEKLIGHMPGKWILYSVISVYHHLVIT